ncbi:hypothetical protein GGI35DRAFT_144370 [Trichoderma velutinum]
MDTPYLHACTYMPCQPLSSSHSLGWPAGTTTALCVKKLHMHRIYDGPTRSELYDACANLANLNASCCGGGKGSNDLYNALCNANVQQYILSRPLIHLYILYYFFYILLCSCLQIQNTARMYIPPYPAKLEALQRHGPTNGYTQWIRHQLATISAVIKPTSTIKQGISLIGRRSSSAAHTNLIIGLVVGFTIAAFLIGVAIFLCCYGDSIRFSKKKHRHRRRSTSSKGSRNSKNSREAEHAEGGAEGEQGA